MSTCLLLIVIHCIWRINCVLECYQGPDPHTNISPYFKITLTQSTTTMTPHIYFSRNNNNYSDAGNMFHNRSVSWIDFGQKLSDTTQVQVTLLNQGQFDGNPDILPISYNIKVDKLSPSTITFNVTGYHKHISLEYNSSNSNVVNSFKNSLLIFAGPLDPKINQNDPNTLYFGPGEHSIVGDMNTKNGILDFDKDTIFLARGAWVYGKINVNGASSGISRNAPINILGHGVLDGSYFNYEQRNNNPTDHSPAIGVTDNGYSRGFNIQGMTCYNPSNWCVTCLTQNSVISGYKAIAWYYNNDGMGLSSNSTMTDSFIRTNDDSVKLACGGPSTVERTVIWQLYNGSPFQMGWNGNGCDNCLVRDNDIIHAEWQGWQTGTHQQPNDGIIDMDYGEWGGSGAKYRNFTVMDLRVDTSVGRFISLTLNCNTTEGVQVEDMVVRDVLIRKNMSWTVNSNKPSQIINVEVSLNGGSYLDGLLFSNVSIMGNKVMSDSDWNLNRYSVDNKYVQNVKYQ